MSPVQTLMVSIEELRLAVQKAMAEPQPSILELTNLRQRLVEFEVTLPEIAQVEQVRSLCSCIGIIKNVHLAQHLLVSSLRRRSM